MPTSRDSTRCLAGDADYVAQMDCDFSHDPADVPRLIAAVDAGADLAIGSRYVAGGGTSNWGLFRQFLSRGASVFTRLILMPVHDATGGFKCFRREVLEAIDLDSIDAAGYVFQVETTFRARRKGFRIVEIPIQFADRTAGTSKMSAAVALEGVLKVPLLRLAACVAGYERARRDDVRCCRRGRSRCSSTSGRRGAGRARRSSRSSRSCPSRSRA